MVTGKTKMTLKEFRSITKSMPDTIEMEIFNPCFEWYGLEPMYKEAWKKINGKLIFSFGNMKWENTEMKEYKKQKEG